MRRVEILRRVLAFTVPPSSFSVLASLFGAGHQPLYFAIRSLLGFHAFSSPFLDLQVLLAAADLTGSVSTSTREIHATCVAALLLPKTAFVASDEGAGSARRSNPAETDAQPKPLLIAAACYC